VQSARARASDQFREAQNGVMFSSDVTARGNCSIIVRLLHRNYLVVAGRHGLPRCHDGDSGRID
jgi:hypothetical protein